MDDLNSILTAWAPILVVLVGVIIWFIRLEAKVSYLSKDHESHKQSTKEKDAMMWAKIDALQASVNLILQSLARLEGRSEGGHGS